MNLEEKVMLYMTKEQKSALEIAVIMDYAKKKCIAATLSKLHKKGFIKANQVKNPKRKPTYYYYLENI